MLLQDCLYIKNQNIKFNIFFLITLEPRLIFDLRNFTIHTYDYSVRLQQILSISNKIALCYWLRLIKSNTLILDLNSSIAVFYHPARKLFEEKMAHLFIALGVHISFTATLPNRMNQKINTEIGYT